MQALLLLLIYFQLLVDPFLQKRIDFEAHYPTDCSILNNTVSREVLMTVAKGYGALVQKICEWGEYS